MLVVPTLGKRGQKNLGAHQPASLASSWLRGPVSKDPLAKHLSTNNLGCFLAYTHTPTHKPLCTHHYTFTRMCTHIPKAGRLCGPLTTPLSPPPLFLSPQVFPMFTKNESRPLDSSAAKTCKALNPGRFAQHQSPLERLPTATHSREGELRPQRPAANRCSSPHPQVPGLLPCFPCAPTETRDKGEVDKENGLQGDLSTGSPVSKSSNVLFGQLLHQKVLSPSIFLMWVIFI